MLLTDKCQSWEHLTWILGTGKSQFLSLWPKNDFDAVILSCHVVPILLQPTYLFIHMLEGEIQIKRVFWGRERKSDLCICEVLAKNVLALAKKLTSQFLKNESFIGFFFLAFDYNFHCIANIFTIFFWCVFIYKNSLLSLSLCIYACCVWITQSYFYVLCIRKLSLDCPDQMPIPPLWVIFSKMCCCSKQQQLSFSHHRSSLRRGRMHLVPEVLPMSLYHEIGSPGAKNTLPEVRKNS